MIPTVVVANWVHGDVLDRLGAHFQVVANETREPWPRAELIARCASADALIAFMTESIDDDFLARCPRLRIVACALKGYDNFDAAACARRGVWLTIVPDLLTSPTAELTVGLTIALARKIVDGDRSIRREGFEGWRPRFYGSGLDGSTVGLLGAGAVGQAVARRLGGFGCRLLYADVRPVPPAVETALGMEWRPLGDIAPECDYLVVCLPLNDASHDLVDAAFLARLPPGAHLINPSRGSVVDEEAVADALASGRLAGYAADVFAMEDWALPDRPRQIPTRLLAMADKTVFTPHIGSAVDGVRRDIAMRAVDNLVDWSERKVPRDAVNHPAVEDAAGKGVLG